MPYKPEKSYQSAHCVLNTENLKIILLHLLRFKFVHHLDKISKVTAHTFWKDDFFSFSLCSNLLMFLLMAVSYRKCAFLAKPHNSNPTRKCLHFNGSRRSILCFLVLSPKNEERDEESRSQLWVHAPRLNYKPDFYNNIWSRLAVCQFTNWQFIESERIM